MKNYYFLIIALITFNLTMAQTIFYPVYDGIFGGANYEQNFSVATGSESWAGFANNNTSIYPLSFPNAGSISFKATVAADTNVYFRFEANPHPNVEPSFNTAEVTILAAGGPLDNVYTVDIPASTNTYNSALLYVVERDQTVVMSEIKIITNGLSTEENTTSFPVYEGIFGGASYEQNFSVATGSESWAGFANNNTSVYPLSFPDAGSVSFKATVAADTNVYFRFEANPHPNIEPSSNTAEVTILAAGGPLDNVYTVDIPASTNTYNSALFYVVERDQTVVMSEIKIIQNASTAGVEDFAANAVKMYPNPAKGFVNFSSASNEALDVAVYDMLGKEVLRANAVQSQLNISNLNPGMYFVNMTQGSNSATKKLVVK